MCILTHERASIYKEAQYDTRPRVPLGAPPNSSTWDHLAPNVRGSLLGRAYYRNVSVCNAVFTHKPVSYPKLLIRKSIPV